jgi:hypothetical protein
MVAERWTPDALVLDSQGHPVMLVELGGFRRAGVPLEEWLAGRVESSGFNPPYVMWVDLNHIRIWRWNGKTLSGPVYVARVDEVLGAYDSSGLAEKDVHDSYREALVMAWLRDLAYQWCHATPPGYETLKELGIADRLRNGRPVVQPLTPA